MTQPTLFKRRAVADGVEVFPSFFPIPGMGMLPVNSYLIRAEQPVLVDTGVPALKNDFMSALRSAIDPRELRWIWLTHVDPDHVGALREVLAEAPHARIVTSFLGMGKMMVLELPLDRVHLINPGQSLDIGGRRLHVLRPPTFDAPETMAIFDERTRTLFSSDSFGGLMGQPVEEATDLSDAELREGTRTWATVDAPWLHLTDEALLKEGFDRVRRLDPAVILSSHFVPARGITEVLVGQIALARRSSPWMGPDQAELERMMNTGPTAA